MSVFPPIQFSVMKQALRPLRIPSSPCLSKGATVSLKFGIPLPDTEPSQPMLMASEGSLQLGLAIHHRVMVFFMPFSTKIVLIIPILGNTLQFSLHSLFLHAAMTVCQTRCDFPSHSSEPSPPCPALLNTHSPWYQGRGQCHTQPPVPTPSALSDSAPCVTAQRLCCLQGTSAVSPKDEKNISKIGQTALENYRAELQNVAGKQDRTSS